MEKKGQDDEPKSINELERHKQVVLEALETLSRSEHIMTDEHIKRAWELLEGLVDAGLKPPGGKDSR